MRTVWVDPNGNPSGPPPALTGPGSVMPVRCSVGVTSTGEQVLLLSVDTRTPSVGYDSRIAALGMDEPAHMLRPALDV